MSRIWFVVIGVIGIAAGAWWYTQRQEEAVQSPEHTASSTPAVVSTTTISAATSTSTTTPVSAQLVDSVATTSANEPKPLWKKGIATTFWVGEGEGVDNGYISNVPSAWDGQWMTHYGGVDDPENRCGFVPCAFTPKENPFYVALPYNDLDDNGDTKPNAKRIPWYRVSEKSILKNRWIAVRANGTTCYGQWQDVGPFHEDDIEYVFGTAQTPLNTQGEKAGIDLSPALSACVGIDGSEEVEWRHVETAAVPQGPWKDIVTTRISQ